MILYKEIFPQNGIETVNAVKKYMKKTDDALEDLLNSFRKANR